MCIMDFRCIIVVFLQICIYIQLFQAAASQAPSPLAIECRDTTTCPCCITSCPLDGSGNCDGNCKDGYHGNKCLLKCPVYCVRCVDALYGDGVANCTLCKDGYFSTATQYQCQQLCPTNCKTCWSSTHCTSCKDGYYLTSSNKCARCNDDCLTCTSATVCSSCKPGFYQDGGTCIMCSPLCASCTSNDSCICSVGCTQNSCNQYTGVCLYSCEDNFMLDIENKCDSCIFGMYGYKCDKTCGEHCKSSCDRITGICTTCKPGFYGDHCDEQCPMNCELECNRTSGNCARCMDGYYGNTCSAKCNNNCETCEMIDGMCTTCIDGYYGDTCNTNCSENCILDKCNKEDGNCVCKPGYYGDRCEFKVTTPGTTIDSGIVIPGSVSHKSVGIIVGVAVVGIVVAISCIVVGILCYRRRLREVQQGSDYEKTKRKKIEHMEREISKLDDKIIKTRQDLQATINRRDELQTKVDENRQGGIGPNARGKKEDYYELLHRSRDAISPYSSLNN